MKAEFLKLRSMPTPRWTAAIMLFCFVAGLVISFIWGVGPDNDTVDGAIGLPSMIASLVLGSWIVGVEFGQHTLRRAFSADPRRERFVLIKLAVLLIVVVGGTLLLMTVAAVLYDLAGSSHSWSIDFGEVKKMIAATLVTNVVWSVCAMSLTLITRSMAGGITLTFAFIFVIDGLISLIPKVGDFTLGIFQNDVDVAIRGQDGFFDQATVHSTEFSVIGLLVWLVVLVAAGLLRTRASEAK